MFISTWEKHYVCYVLEWNVRFKFYFEIDSMNYVIMCDNSLNWIFKYKTCSVGIWMDLECNNAVYSYTGNMKNAQSRP